LFNDYSFTPTPRLYAQKASIKRNNRETIILSIFAQIPVLSFILGFYGEIRCNPVWVSTFCFYCSLLTSRFCMSGPVPWRAGALPIRL
jgi:hypothetical protein